MVIKYVKNWTGIVYVWATRLGHDDVGKPHFMLFLPL